MKILQPKCSAHQTIGYRSRTCFGYLKRRKIGLFLLGKTRFVAVSQTPSLRWTDSLCATPRQGFSFRVCDLCVAFHQSWGFRSHRNQSKQPDVHRFTDTRETWFFRLKLCFSGFFLLDFSVRRNNTTVVNYLWGLGFKVFFLFHQSFHGKEGSCSFNSQIEVYTQYYAYPNLKSEYLRHEFCIPIHVMTLSAL